MWFVFPQFRGLGHSETAERYAIQSVAEARAYLAHPVLGSRLRECSQILLSLKTSSPLEVFGSPDDLKLKSCMTLFDGASEGDRVFCAVIQKFFKGQRDQLTIDMLR